MNKIIKTFVILLCLGLFPHRAQAEEVLTWGDCLVEAQKNHPDLISAQEAVKESEADKRITQSTLLPQVDSSVSGATAKASGATTDTYRYGVTATQLLFDGSKTGADMKAASENVKAAQYQYRFASSEVRLALRSAFIDLLKAQESLQLTEDIYKIRRGNLDLITLRYESGLEHRGALLNAETNLIEAEFEIAQAKRALEVAQKGLLKEMGRLKFTALRAEGDFKVSDAALEKPDFEALANTAPSLGKLIAQKHAAGFDIKSAEANFFPELSASAGANRTSSHWPPEDERWDAAVTLSFPLFEGGLRTAQVDKAKAAYHQARADERSAKDTLLVTLEETWAALQDAVETVEVQRKSLEAAEERARIAEAQYSLGSIGFDNWTIIEDDLVKTKKAFLNAQAAALLAEAEWIQAKGETLEDASQ
ncbi:MAG: TolC family protein [Candidatus Omnitrophota bacterium]